MSKKIVKKEKFIHERDVEYVYDKHGIIKDVAGHPIRKAIRYSYVTDKDGNVKPEIINEKK